MADDGAGDAERPWAKIPAGSQGGWPTVTSTSVTASGGCSPVARQPRRQPSL